MGKYLYRAQPGYEKGTPIRCKDPNSDVSMASHIAYGSRKNDKGELIYKSKYISCTKSISVGMIYSLGDKENRNVNSREPVVLIDAEKLATVSPIHDTSEPEVFAEISKNKWAANFAPASKEVLTEIEIPADCIKEVPVICVDMIRALECVQSKYSSKIIEMINDLIMNDDPTFKTLLDNLKFNGKLQEFYEQYYKNGNTSLERISSQLFGGDQELANCARVQLVKDLFKNPDLIQYLAFQAIQTGNMSVNDLINGIKFIDEQFVDLIDPCVAMTAEKEQKTSIINGGLAIEINCGERLSLPWGVRLEEKNGQVYATKLTQEYVRIDGRDEVSEIRIEQKDGKRKVNESQPINISKMQIRSGNSFICDLEQKTCNDEEYVKNMESLVETTQKQLRGEQNISAEELT